ncbi:hypothetical protein EYZ11_009135 [Aspergillus tanneri]|uniref:Uncharacterized protein n=1 Tax=Aspergillus tanneri TaxID=1220188 RepID=A0A4S3J8S6_9EURO|nr:uncharacterized protein ATNIH1004_003779 [Aspergillus tanneri]KAA8651086.1 hypothetical protein ATNIH1004_003779 [Aspergillus tanneri]THC91406.1 hypothetical protein EYZ11_009135 [Aspergillus tanneri]
MALDYLPSWGQLPVEQYLIESWNPASTEQPSTQRARLVKQFLNIDHFNADWDPTRGGTNPDAQPVRVPTEEEISIILRPWRSDDIRRRAWRVWEAYTNTSGNNPVLLRTWYNPKDDERVKSWATLSEFFEDDADWAILDNPAVFNFGTGPWQQVLEIIPEIAARLFQDDQWVRRKDWRVDNRFYSRFKDRLNAVKRSNPSWRSDLNILVKENTAARSFLHLVSRSYILIADKETFETDHFLLAYLDARGRVTMQGRILVDEDRLTQVSLERFQAIPPMEVFDEGELGPDYVVAAGNAGDREVYYWTREDLEDDPPPGDEDED